MFLSLYPVGCFLCTPSPVPLFWPPPVSSVQGIPQARSGLPFPSPGHLPSRQTCISCGGRWILPWAVELMLILAPVVPDVTGWLSGTLLQSIFWSPLPWSAGGLRWQSQPPERFHLFTAWRGIYLLCLSASGAPNPLLCTGCFYYPWIMFYSSFSFYPFYFPLPLPSKTTASSKWVK